MRFICKYSARPICSPARASVMMGKYPVRTGIANTTNSFGGTQRPNQIGPSATEGNIYDRLNNYSNTASFANPARFTLPSTESTSNRPPGRPSGSILLAGSTRRSARVSCGSGWSSTI